MTSLRAENELLICIARHSLDEGAGDRLRSLLQKEVDWDYLLRAASDHGLLPLLCNHLSTAGTNFIPGKISERLRKELFSSRQDNLYLTRQLLSVLQLFAASGIRALAFKGPILGEMLYGDLGLRQAGDLDILIGKDDFIRSKELLQSNSYLMEPQLTAAQQKSHLRFHCEIQFVHRDQFSVVDLHWGLTPKNFPFTLSFEDLWERRKSTRLAGHSIETFAAEDLLLYLCVHGAKHYWIKLEWVAAVAELIRSSGRLDWDAIITRARETNTEKILILGLMLARDLFDIDLPQEFCQVVEGRKGSHQSARAIAKDLFRDYRKPTPLEMIRLNFELMDRPRDAMHSLLLAVMLPTISDWQAKSFPDALYPLYYVLRPIRLLNKHRRRHDQ